MKIIALFIFVLSISISAGEWIPGKVSRVHDGDTFNFVSDKGDKIKVRVAEIDCPELDQNDGKFIRDVVNEVLLSAEKVFIYEMGKDRYGRSICLVEFIANGNRFGLSETLLKMGYAWYYEPEANQKDQNSDNRKLIFLEAVKNKVGLFKVNSIEPKIWRDNKNLIITDDGFDLTKRIEIMNPDKEIKLSIIKK